MLPQTTLDSGFYNCPLVFNGRENFRAMRPFSWFSNLNPTPNSIKLGTRPEPLRIEARPRIEPKPPHLISFKRINVLIRYASLDSLRFFSALIGVLICVYLLLQNKKLPALQRSSEEEFI